MQEGPVGTTPPAPLGTVANSPMSYATSLALHSCDVGKRDNVSS